MKIVIFPNDPLNSYYDKGEVQERYFNPNNIFDEILVISPSYNDINPQKVQSMFGNASIKIECIGNLTLKTYKKKLEDVIELIDEFNPDYIRSYNPLFQGWLAAKTAETLEIPFILSLHNNYDDYRKQTLKSDLKKYLKLRYLGSLVEPYVIRNADKVIIVYKGIEPYVSKFRSDFELIYNKTNLEWFKPGNKEPNNRLIYVARLEKEKNHETIIKAVQDLDVKLVLIGYGPEFRRLKAMDKNNKVDFIPSVPNENLAEWYNSSSIFLYPNRQLGIGKPVLEAMACGLPIISLVRPVKEVFDSAMMFVYDNPESFAMGINYLLGNKTKYHQMSDKSISMIEQIKNMEAREAQVYLKCYDEGHHVGNKICADCNGLVEFS